MLKLTDSISSISQIHSLLSYDPPVHPLITLLESDKLPPKMPVVEKPVLTELYAISLKNGRQCLLKYGRRRCDFQEGAMLFLAPGQCLFPFHREEEDSEPPFRGWTLVFHPDLIRRFPLQKEMAGYSFFQYSSSEALILSEEERKILTDLAFSIKDEFCKNLDSHSSRIIVTQIELLLNYCRRFYSRQFITRATENRDILDRFESFVLEYYNSGQAEKRGLLSVQSCAAELGYTAHYLSDLLKKETGKNAQEHIQFFLLEKAKNLLLSSREPVNIIASSLGFEYSQHFSKFFKDKVGLAPRDYRFR